MEEEAEAEEEQHQQQPLPQHHPMEVCRAYNPKSSTEPAPTQMTSGHNSGGTKWLTAPTTP